MSVETITEALQEHMYEKLNDSPETEEKKIRYLNNRKAESDKEPMDKQTEFKKLDCNRCGAPNWPRQPKCPARRKNARNVKRLAITRNVAEQTKE